MPCRGAPGLSRVAAGLPGLVLVVGPGARGQPQPRAPGAARPKGALGRAAPV